MRACNCGARPTSGARGRAEPWWVQRQMPHQASSSCAIFSCRGGAPELLPGAIIDLQARRYSVACLQSLLSFYMLCRCIPIMGGGTPTGICLQPPQG